MSNPLMNKDNHKVNEVVMSYLEGNTSMEHLLLEWNSWNLDDKYDAFCAVATHGKEPQVVAFHQQVRDSIVEVVTAKAKKKQQK